MKNLAIVTGASSGLGYKFVEAFDNGVGGPLDEIWVIARREEHLKNLAQRCKTPVRVFALDLREEASFDIIQEALAEDEEVVNVQWLVNNAGFGKFGDFSQHLEEQNVDMVKLNCLAVLQMCYHCSMYMHAGSRIINMSSVAAFLPQPQLSIYSACKRFVLDFSRSLDFELASVGIRVCAVCPKFMHTEFLNEPGNAEEVIRKTCLIGFEDAGRVVRKAIHAAILGKTCCIPSYDMKALNLGCKILPVRWVMKGQEMLSDILDPRQ